MICGLSHITIAVSDLGKALVFCREVLGFQAHVRWYKGAYLSIDSVWLWLSLDKVVPSNDYSRIAWAVTGSEFAMLSNKNFGI